MGAHHQDGKTGQLSPQGKDHMSVERLPGHAEGIPFAQKISHAVLFTS